MNPFGPFGNLMPYSNLHGMNLDWVIQIAKDFLDQYTHIQKVIENGEVALDEKTTQGLAALTQKGTEISSALDQWYATHSEDIADQLADSLAEIAGMTTDVEDIINAIIAETISSIPADYTRLSQEVQQLAKMRAISQDTENIKLTDGNLRIGAVIPKGFDGRQAIKYYPKLSSYDVVFSNEDGDIAGIINKGRILHPSIVGKNISILGDSISAYTKPYYKMPGQVTAHYPRYDVTSPTQMWYSIVCDTLGANFLSSASWGGTTVTGDPSDENGQDGLSQARIDALSRDGIDPDIVLVEMGTNDFGTSVNLGAEITGTESLPDGSSDILTFNQAYLYMLVKIHETYPKAKVGLLTILPRKSDANITTTEYPSVINGHCINDFNESIKNIASIMNCFVINVDNAGFNSWNIDQGRGGAQYERFYGDNFLHPNKTGMAMIANYVINALLKEV